MKGNATKKAILAPSYKGENISWSKQQENEKKATESLSSSYNRHTIKRCITLTQKKVYDLNTEWPLAKAKWTYSSGLILAPEWMWTMAGKSPSPHPNSFKFQPFRKIPLAGVSYSWMEKMAVRVKSIAQEINSDTFTLGNRVSQEDFKT